MPTTNSQILRLSSGAGGATDQHGTVLKFPVGSNYTAKLLGGSHATWTYVNSSGTTVNTPVTTAGITILNSAAQSGHTLAGAGRVLVTRVEQP